MKYLKRFEDFNEAIDNIDKYIRYIKNDDLFLKALDLKKSITNDISGFLINDIELENNDGVFDIFIKDSTNNNINELNKLVSYILKEHRYNIESKVCDILLNSNISRINLNFELYNNELIIDNYDFIFKNQNFLSLLISKIISINKYIKIKYDEFISEDLLHNLASNNKIYSFYNDEYSLLVCDELEFDDIIVLLSDFYDGSDLEFDDDFLKDYKKSRNDLEKIINSI